MFVCVVNVCLFVRFYVCLFVRFYVCLFVCLLMWFHMFYVNMCRVFMTLYCLVCAVHDNM